MTFVLDASVAIAGVIPDESSQRAEAVLSRLTATHAVVPSLWIYEVASALRSAESRGRITEADSVLALRGLSALPLTTAEPDIRHVAETARAFGLSVYDASYLALSMSRGLPLATLDTRLAAAAVSAGVALLC